jgi:hypothetical protein
MPIESPTVIILGAGFSYVAGLPLAKDLFDAEMFAPSKAAERRFSAVLQSWRAWQSTHPGHGPEQFLTEIYHSPMIGAVPWVWAVETVATALATPLPRDRGTYQTRYAGRITRPVNVPEHIAFWDLVLSRFAIAAVVTTNYDLLAERGLRHRPTQRPKRPGMHYGGLIRPQILKGTAFPFSIMKQERQIELEGGIPLYKLHGSLNWGLETGVLSLYQDNRPAFRHGSDAQIVAGVRRLPLRPRQRLVRAAWPDPSAHLTGSTPIGCLRSAGVAGMSGGHDYEPGPDAHGGEAVTRATRVFRICRALRHDWFSKIRQVVVPWTTAQVRSRLGRRAG